MNFLKPLVPAERSHLTDSIMDKVI